MSLYELIGEGSYGSTFLVRDTSSDVNPNLHQAIKVITFPTSTAALDSRNRIEALTSKLDPDKCFKNNIHTYHITCHENELFFESGFALFGSLRELLLYQNVVDGCIPECVIAYSISCVLKALSYMHSIGIPHGNVKASNLMIHYGATAPVVPTPQGETPVVEAGPVQVLAGNELPEIFLMDHCWSMALGSAFPFIPTDISHSSPTPASSWHLRDWTAPELLSKPFVPSSPLQTHLSGDIYSLGITLLELTNPHHVPLAKSLDQEHMGRIRQYDVPRFVDGTRWSLHLINFYAQCVQYTPSMRPSVYELLNHEWLYQRGLLEQGRSELARMVRRYVPWRTARIRSFPLVDPWNEWEKIYRTGNLLKLPILGIDLLERPMLYTSTRHAGESSKQSDEGHGGGTPLASVPMQATIKQLRDYYAKELHSNESSAAWDEMAHHVLSSWSNVLPP